MLLRSVYMVLISQPKYCIAGALLLFVFLIAGFWDFSSPTISSWSPYGLSTSKHDAAETEQLLLSITVNATIFADKPLGPLEFGVMGRRVETMREWITLQETKLSSLDAQRKDFLATQINKAVASTFPFIRRPSSPTDPLPFTHLRSSFKSGTQGIVIPTGKKTFRFACHLVSTLRNVLMSELPIQIVYAGDEDLPTDFRDAITGLGDRIETLDIIQVLDDTTLELAKGGWAIKAFATLASSFEEVILMDADAVFVQKPEAILNDHPGYADTGALLFHDRLLWQGAFKERHKWWETEMKGRVPSATLNKSKVYNEGYAEEGDSGVVVLDKRRLPVLMGLLHICWQNTREVRDKVTYTMGYGDKESWWFGLELSGANYTFEDHYGAILGVTKQVDGKTKVCSFTIAHLDAKDKLLWYNGSLLKNKAVNQKEFLVPSHWMVDAVWEKGGSKPEISCMRDGVVRDVTTEEESILSRSVDAAKMVDEKLKDLIDRAAAG